MTKERRDPDYLPVMESFYTIQGEGHYTGTPAYFIRLGGCDVGCHWCDVKESWEVGKFEWLPVDTIVDEVKKSGTNRAVITGGEPCMYDLAAFTTALRDVGVKTHIETSGAYPLTGTWDWICFSPKKFKKPLSVFFEQASELKVVIYHQSDFDWAVSHADQMNESSLLFLQPEWSKEKEMTPLIVDYIKAHPKWKISLQTHKYIGVP